MLRTAAIYQQGAEVFLHFNHCRPYRPLRSVHLTVLGPAKPCGFSTISGAAGLVGTFVLVAQSCLTLCDPMDCSPPGSSVHGILQAKHAGVGCHALLQGIFPTQGSNPRFSHCM